MSVSADQLREINPDLTDEEIAFVIGDMKKADARAQAITENAMREERERAALIPKKFKYVVNASPQAISMKITAKASAVDVLKSFYECAKEVGFAFQSVDTQVEFQCDINTYLLLADYRKLFRITCTTEVKENFVNIVRGSFRR